VPGPVARPGRLRGEGPSGWCRVGKSEIVVKRRAGSVPLQWERLVARALPGLAWRAGYEVSCLPWTSFLGAGVQGRRATLDTSLEFSNFRALGPG
jgi:hypothetical protein